MLASSLARRILALLLLGVLPHHNALVEWTGSNLPASCDTPERIKDQLSQCPRINEAFIRTDVLKAMLEQEAPPFDRADQDPAPPDNSFEPFFYSSLHGDYDAHEFALKALLDNDGVPMETLPRMPCGPLDEVKAEVDFVKLVGNCKLVVATAIFGKRDVLHPPAPTQFPQHVCYLAFLDDATAAFMEEKGYRVGSTCEGWQVTRYNKPTTGSTRLDSRIFKLLLPRLLPPSVRWSIWLDSKHRLDVDPVRVLHLMLWQYNATWAVPSHPKRVSIHDEQKAVVNNGMVTQQMVQQQRDHHASRGFSLNTSTGLLEGALHLRDHAAFLPHLLSCAWWNELVRFPPRDQLSFNYLLFRLAFTPAVSQHQFLALRLLASTTPDGHYRPSVHLTYDLRSAVFNATIHVNAYCDFVAMMPNMYHATLPSAEARLSRAMRIVEAAAAARGGSQGRGVVAQVQASQGWGGAAAAAPHESQGRGAAWPWVRRGRRGRRNRRTGPAHPGGEHPG